MVQQALQNISERVWTMLWQECLPTLTKQTKKRSGVQHTSASNSDKSIHTSSAQRSQRKRDNRVFDGERHTSGFMDVWQSQRCDRLEGQKTKQIESLKWKNFLIKIMKEKKKLYTIINKIESQNIMTLQYNNHYLIVTISLSLLNATYRKWIPLHLINSVIIHF